nr:hypothetical protein [Eisenibacter elegans]
MKTLKLLKIQFGAVLLSREIPAFRGAIIHKVGQQDTLLFHNHLDDQRYHYAYPLVQYKVLNTHPWYVWEKEWMKSISFLKSATGISVSTNAASL